MIDPNQPIYDVYLVTIGNYAKLNTTEKYNLDLNFKNAILTNNLEILKRVLVQPTNNNDEFREIITNKKLKSCIVYTTLLSNLLKTESFSNVLIEDYTLIKPIYHHYKTKYPSYRSEAYEKHFIKADSKRIEEYISNHSNKDEYNQELDNIIKQAEEDYLERIKTEGHTLKKTLGGKIMKIPNDTEVAVIFERSDEEGKATVFRAVKVVIGHSDKKKKVFVANDGKEYQYMVATRDEYSFGLRKTVGELNAAYKKKTLKKLLEAHTLGISQFIFYFQSDQKGKNIDLVCEDDEENIFVVQDKDFESYKKHILNPETKYIEEPIKIKVNAKELIKEVKKKVIGQDDIIEDVVSTIWENSKSKRKQNILLIGPTGVGKTEIARTIAEKLDLPVGIADMTNTTQSGYHGNSVEDALESLLIKCNYDISKAENAIMIIDEIDKIATNNDANNDVATTGVQDELLKLVEDGEYTVNISKDLTMKDNIIINTKNMTFIAMGAFTELLEEKNKSLKGEKIPPGFKMNNDTPKKIEKEPKIEITTEDLKKYGIKPELAGRFPNIILLNALTKENLIQIIKNPYGETMPEKIKILNDLGIKLNIDEAIYDKLATKALKRNTGARGLNGEIDKLFRKAMNEISQNEDAYEELYIDEKTLDNPKAYTLVKKKSNN